MLERIKSFPLKEVPMDWGNVLRAYRCGDEQLTPFQEVYFSWVKKYKTRDWKRHLRMTMNLVVPVGDVKFVFFDEQFKGEPRVELIGEKQYARLFVPPGVWFSFRAAYDKDSLLVNFADVIHDPHEVERCSAEEVLFDWRDS